MDALELPRVMGRLKAGFARLAEWDREVLERVSSSRLLSPLSSLFTGATYLGDGYLWGWLALLLILRGEPDRRYVLIGLGITIINVIIYTLIKLYFKRERPIPFPSFLPLRSQTLERYSFPSGHASVAFGVALMVIHFYPIIWAQIGVYLLAAFISLSRIYVREHYPSDVLAGALLGTGITALLLPLFSRFIL